jgi:hypothetical protein
MSLYNLMHGANPATFFILPMLGEKHPDQYPRFRDCFVAERDGQNVIQLYTRVGGGNRNSGFGEEELYKHPNFLTTEDDDFDSTYASYYFSVPGEFKTDFELILEGKLKETSQEYKDRVYSVFPKIKEKLEKILS